jgi:hypothetical protein
MRKVGGVMSHDATAEQLDTPRSFARVINSTPQTVLNWHHAGILPAKIAVGRIIRFDRAEAIAALAAHGKKGGVAR